MILTIAVISLSVVSLGDKGDEMFSIRTKTGETEQDALAEDHSEIYRLVQRDEKSISELRKAIDGNGIIRIENIDTAESVLALIQGEKVSGKRRRSPRAQPDDEESDDGEEHGKRSSRDKEGQDTEDMSEFKTCCWDCKRGDYQKSHYSRKQCREVRWILLSYCDYVLLCVVRIFCVICYNTL